MFLATGVRQIGPAESTAARQLCDVDPVTNVFVAARLDEGALSTGMGSAYSTDPPGPLRSMVWSSANIVPVSVAPDDFPRYAQRIRRGGRRFSSVFGPADQVLPLWHHLGRWLRTPQSVRPEQPVMVATTAARAASGVVADLRVRPATLDELDILVPAAAAMFTEEIGYRPYLGSDASYRLSVRALIRAGRSFVLSEGGRIRFKADVGSLASGVAQIQGVWIDPEWRGRGLAAPCMARVVDLIQEQLAETVSLYVNDYNLPALRAYERAGFERVGTFATIIL